MTLLNDKNKIKMNKQDISSKNETNLSRIRVPNAKIKAMTEKRLL